MFHPPQRTGRAPWSTPSGIAALAFVAVAVITLASFLRSLVIAFLSQTVAEFTDALSASPWAKATLMDYSVGAIFAAAWIATRPTSPLLGISNALWALFLPPLGNPILYLYLILTVLRERSVHTTFIPHSDPSAPVTNEPSSRTSTKHHAQIFGIGFVILAFCYFATLSYAILTENVLSAFQLYFPARSLLRATFYDVLLGIAVVASLILLREGLSAPSLVWIFALILLGHGVSCLYAALVARDALLWNITIGEAFATGRPASRGTLV